MRRLLLLGVIGVCTIGLVSCSDDKEDGGGKIPAGEKTKAYITVAVGPYADQQTSDDERTGLSNVWLLGFDKDGKNVQASKLTSLELDKKVEVDVVAGANMKLVVAANLDASFTEGGLTYSELTKTAYTGTIASFDAVPLVGEIPYSIEEAGKELQTVVVSQIAAQVSFTIPIAAGYSITSVSLKNVVNSPYFYSQGDNTALEESEYKTIAVDASVPAHTYFISENLSGTEAGITSAKEKVTQKNALHLEVVAVKEDNETISTATFRYYFGDNETTDFNVRRNKSYSFDEEIDFDDPADLRVTVQTAGVVKNAVSSNTYMLSPEARYSLGIPVSRVNEFWDTPEGGNDKSKVITDGSNGGQVTSWRARVIASDNDNDLISIVSGEGSNAGDYLVVEAAGAGLEGNVIVAVYDAAVGESAILWSWHIWVTGYNPGGDINGDIPEITETIGQAEVPGGKIFRTPGISTAPVVAQTMGMMDRNLGALDSKPEGGLKTVGAYYQWGRKDPFMMKFNEENISLSQFDPVAETVTKGKAIQNPTVYYIGNGNTWLEDDDQYLWKAQNASKTIYDPCPAGWRVPPTESFLNGDNNYSNFSGAPLSVNGYFACSVLYGPKNMDNYFPLVGYVVGATGKISSVFGNNLYLWGGTQHSATAGRITRFLNPITMDEYDEMPIYTGQGHSKINGTQVRCVKE